MKKKFLLILMLLLPAITISLFSQPMASMRVPYRQLIISEYSAAEPNSYVELTNVGDSTVNLNEHWIFSCNQRSVALGAANIIRDTEGNLVNAYFTAISDDYKVRLPNFLLKPGESFVMMPVYDRTTEKGELIQREKMVEASKFFIHMRETAADSTIYKSYYPHYQNFNFDSISRPGASNTSGDATLNLNPYGRFIIQQRVYNSEGVVYDSVLIDGFKHLFNPTGGGDWEYPNIAGVSAAPTTHTLVRKSSVTHGNLNWNLSAGVSAEDSEWLPIPKLSTRNIWTTVGKHGNFSPSATSAIIGIDLAGQTLTVPWGIYKIANGDSLFNFMTLGPGMAWRYQTNSQNFESGSHSIVQDGDTLMLYTTGAVLDRKYLRIIQQDPAANETRVFPMRTLKLPNPIIPFDSLTWGDMPYYVTQYPSIPDTIGNIPYATRVDSLFTYLEKAEKATWEIIWVDGLPRVDLLNGDILKVTAENGTDTKDYYLDVLPFAPGHNAFLASITWPDKPGFLMGWDQDTIPRFDSRVTVYNILLPYHHSGVPALQTTLQDPDAMVTIFPAKSIDGTAADRTTHIQVTAEDDSVVLNYYIVFNKEKLAEQAWEAEPMFSELSYRAPTDPSAAIEIYNPGTLPIDLSNYMIITHSNTLKVALAAASTMTAGQYSTRYSRGYIPGFKWPGTSAEYLTNPGVMVFDPVVDPILEPGKTFTMYVSGYEGPYHWINERYNILFLNQYAPAQAWLEFGGNAWGETGQFDAVLRPVTSNTSTWLLKIVNDSIQRGLKPIRDVADFEIIDLWGKNPSVAADFKVAGRPVIASNRSVFIRKPHIYLPSAENLYGRGTNAEDSDWIYIISGDTYNGVVYNGELCAIDLGYHTANDATFFRSVVYSDVYKVDDGFEGNLSISGVSNSENVETFLNNLIKADVGQTLVISATEGGPAKAPADAVAANDLLTVTSQDGLNQTVYSISLAPLDGNNNLTLAGGSSLVLARDGNTGSISGFPFGTTLSSVFEQVVKPELASLIIVDAMGQLLPLSVMNTDVVKVSALADKQAYIKVIAENGTSALYNLQPASSASDAYVLSDLYSVNQEASTVDVVPVGTAVSAFLANLKPVPGATMQIRTKTGGARNLGDLNLDDFLYVTSQDQSVTKIYFIQFIGEAEGLQTEFRTLAPAPSNLILTGVAADGMVASATISWNHDSEMEFGFVITRNGAPVDTVAAATFTDQGLSKGATYQYSVYAYNEFGNSEAVALEVLAWPTAVEQKVANGISIYPNVTTDMVYFSNVPDNSRIVLIDLAGRNILVKNASELKGGLSLQPYANGYYLIKVMKGHEYVESVKILKK